MRKKYEPQTSIFDFLNIVDHSIAKELNAISNRFAMHPEFIDWVYEDIKDVETINPETGRPGMTAESVLRCAFLKSYTKLPYRDLEFYLKDSCSFKAFARLYDLDPDFTTLQRNIAAVNDATIEKMNRVILLDARDESHEKGRMIRTDSTTSQTNIHKPTDSSLLWDCIRVLTRLLNQLKDDKGKRLVPFIDHTRVGKKLAYQIQFASRKKKRLPKYKQLLKHTQNTMRYVINAITHFEVDTQDILKQWAKEAHYYVKLTSQVVSQTKRRVIKEETVPVAEKIVSIFETHTDVIVKGRRDVVFGHKINLTTGKSGLILDMTIEKGNPADSVRVIPMIKRQIEIYGRSPRQASFDGCYASQNNVTDGKKLGVKDVVFHKKRGIAIDSMAKSTWVYKKLRAFRAGIEGNISTLKSRYGFNRVNWKGLPRFKTYLWGSVFAYNLVTLARMELQNE